MSPSESRLCLYNTERQNQNQSPENEDARRRELFLIQYIKCTDKISGIIVAVIGLLTSLWADCIVVVTTCTQNYNKFENMELYVANIIIQTSQLTHFLIVMTCTIGFLYGIKVKNKAYFTPWIFIKIIELIVLFIGTILLATQGNRRYIGIVPFGICFNFIGMYITLSVFNTYKNNNMDEEEIHNSPDSLAEVSINHQIRDPPPSYESHALQSLPT